MELAVRVVAGEVAKQFCRELWFTGELLELARGSHGHGFGVLRGAGARIDVFLAPHLMRGDAPQIGTMVLVRGRLGIWQRGGRFQIRASGELIPVDRTGARAQARRWVEEQLRAEGVLGRKRRELPRWPAEIAVVTSARGAAIHDVRAALRRRAPWVLVRLCDCTVQGPGAAASIVAALDVANRSTADVVLLTRGGGAPDSLDPFDDARVVRRVAMSRLPIIVAVGHESDRTLADLAADRAAATPTAAAELAVQDAETLSREMRGIRRHLHSAARTVCSAAAEQADHRREACRRAAHQGVLLWRERVDRMEPRALATRVGRFLGVARTLLADAVEQVRRGATGTVREQRRRATTLEPEVLVTHGYVAIRADRRRADELIRAIRALSPRAVLARGYALVRGRDGQAIHGCGDVEQGEGLWIQFVDGTVAAVVVARENQRPSQGGEE